MQKKISDLQAGGRRKVFYPFLKAKSKSPSFWGSF